MSVLVRVRVSLGFRERVRVKVRVSFRLATFMYSVWPPVSLRVRVSLGFRVRVSFRHFHVFCMSSSTPFSLHQTPKILASLFNLPPNLYYV